MSEPRFKKFLLGAAIGLVIVVAFGGGAVADRLWSIKPLDRFFARSGGATFTVDQKILTEESVVIEVAESLSPSVVTVSVQTPERRVLEFSPFGGLRSRIEGGQAQDIGTGFVVSSDGLIVTNKHVVSVTGASYKVITKDNKEYEVKNISRDPSNDIAIIKIDATGLAPVELGDSSNLKVGQFVIAIGTALGEFRHTVTTGVISGLGRGVSPVDPSTGIAESLSDLIQTDAAINPGNSGGPLLNSAGQAIGVNSAMASAENIGFAIPINIAKELYDNFKSSGGKISRPFLGIRYSHVSQDVAILNEVPEGEYVQEVVAGSAADKAGLKARDIITKIDGVKLTEEGGLSGIIRSKKIGDKMKLTVWRKGETLEIEVTLGES